MYRKDGMEIVLLFVGLIFLSLGIKVLKTDSRSRGEFKPVQGRVSSFAEIRNTKGRRLFYAIVRLSWMGEVRYVQSSTGASHPLNKIGDSVEVFVEPTNPPRAHLNSATFRMLGWLFAGVGALALCLFVSVFRFSLFTALVTAVLFFQMVFVKKTLKKTMPASNLKQILMGSLLRPLLTETEMLALPHARPDVLQTSAQSALVSKRAFAAFTFLIGLAGSYASGQWLHSRHTFLEQAESAHGIVVRFIETASTKSVTLYTPVVSYRHPASESPAEFREQIGMSHPLVDVGEEVWVLYSPKDPTNAIIDYGLFNYALPLCALLLALFLLFSSGRSLVRSLHA